MKSELKPLVSVVIPVYNVEGFLEDALRSIVEQSYQNLEIICVNDGSTDGSLKILESFLAKDDRIHIISQENHGLSAARNRGMQYASGKYVYFFDSDDFLGKKAFTELIPKMERESLDLFFFDVEPFADEGVPEKTLQHYQRYYHREGSYPGVMTGVEMLIKQVKVGEFLPGVWGYVASRSFLQENGLLFVEGVIHEDNIFTYEAMLLSERVSYINRVFFYRRLRGSSITQSGKTFGNVYGYFVTHLKALEILARERLKTVEGNENKEFLSDPIIIKRIGMWLRNAREDYISLDDKERRKAEELSQEEMALFKMYIEDVCKEILAKQKTEADVRKWRKEADKQKAEAQKLKKRVQEIEASKAYRFGTAVAKPVRAVKKRMDTKKDETRDTSKTDSTVSKTETLDTGSKQKRNMPRKIWLFGSPSHGNLGDHMIAEASVSFLREKYPDDMICEIERDDAIRNFEKICNQVGINDLLFFIGGGNLGNYWLKNEELRDNLIKRFPDHKKVILPQSIQFTDDEAGVEALKKAREVYSDKNLLLICRGKASLDFAKAHFSCDSVMMPDMVMGSKIPVWWKNVRSRSGAVLCLRSDKERFISDEWAEQIKKTLQTCYATTEVRLTDMVRPKPVSPEKRRAELAAQYRLLAGAEVVITDRLHCMIFCAQTETPCVVFPNEHHKIAECYEWISDLPYIRLVQNISELPEALSEVRKDMEKEYPLRRMRNYFSEIS